MNVQGLRPHWHQAVWSRRKVHAYNGMRQYAPTVMALPIAPNPTIEISFCSKVALMAQANVRPRKHYSV